MAECKRKEIFMRKQKPFTKHQLIMYFLKTRNEHGIVDYYFDPVLSQMPRDVLYDQINALVSEGYVKKRIRHIVLTYKCYEYPSEHRKEIFWKVLSMLGRPFGYLVSWGLGILSAFIVEFLIRHITG